MSPARRMTVRLGCCGLPLNSTTPGAPGLPSGAGRVLRQLPPLHQHRLLVLEDLDERPAQVAGEAEDVDAVLGGTRPQPAVQEDDVHEALPVLVDALDDGRPGGGGAVRED